MDNEEIFDGQETESKAQQQLDKEDEHLRLIKEQTEKAKDPKSYETYEACASATDPKVKLFAARKKGEKHIFESIPCQDYCLIEEVNGCIVLADADGVGSCEHSDIGSKLACEAVVRTVAAASKGCSDENRLLKRLTSAAFIERLVHVWLNQVLADIDSKKELSPAEKTKELGKYASTIMFAVLTQNWIVVGNLGDGQVLVFNDAYGIKLRIHDLKLSSSVRCLANERCAREDFLVAKYPRKFFKGVLLTTDGIYESLDKGNLLFEYAHQMKERFRNRQPLEPYQAFCYKEKGEPYKDFSAMRTQDDCSLAVALDESTSETNYQEITECISKLASAALLKRWDLTCISFYIKNNENQYFDVLVSNKSVLDDIPVLKSAHIDIPISTCEDKGYFYSMYGDTNVASMELLFATGGLRRDRHKVEESEKIIATLLCALADLRKELTELGYCLNSSAIFNLWYDGKNLHIRPEALQRLDENNSEVFPDNLNRYFNHILGILENKDRNIPLFDIGYINKGVKYTCLINEKQEELGQLIRMGKELNLKNISSYRWRLTFGDIVAPGDSIPLERDLAFAVVDTNGLELNNYRYLLKEQL